MKRYTVNSTTDILEVGAGGIEAENPEEMLIKFRKLIIDYVNKISLDDICFYEEAIK